MFYFTGINAVPTNDHPFLFFMFLWIFFNLEFEVILTRAWTIEYLISDLLRKEFLYILKLSISEVVLKVCSIV